MNGFKPPESVVKKWLQLQASYTDNSLPGSEAQGVACVSQLDWHCRKFASSTTQPFRMARDPRTRRELFTYSKVGYNIDELLLWDFSLIQSCFNAYELNPHLELMIEKLSSLQQQRICIFDLGYPQNLTKKCLNEIRVAVKSPRFVIDNKEWTAKISQNLAQQKRFIKKAVKKFNQVSLVGLEINQTGLQAPGYCYSTHDLHEVEVQRNLGLKAFFKLLEQDVFKDRLAGVLYSSGFDAYKGLYNRLQLILVCDEDGNTPDVNLQQLNEAWQKSNLPNPVTAEGACLRAQVCMDMGFGVLTDGDAIRQQELKKHLEMLHQREHYRRYASKVFAPCTTTYEAAIMQC